tara:strand:+ start:203 stop:367 length:165 start_codon:yes stop_codon:yes gene_type:complete
MKYTKKQIIKGFANWQTDYRLNPSTFKSDEDIASKDIKDHAKGQLKNLIKYIKQ